MISNVAGRIGSLRDRVFPATSSSSSSSSSSSPQHQHHPNNIITASMPPDTYHQSWGAAPRYEDAINPQYARRIPNTIPANTPYMGAGSRLSQVWFNRWTVLLLLIIVRVVLATISLNGDLDTAREKAFSACTSVESMGSAMASMPFYMAPGVNEMTAKSIEAAVSALKQTMLLMLTGVQEMVVFYTNLIISTYVCLITLVVNGSVGLLVDALKDITDFVNGAMTGILDGAEVGLGSFGVDIKGLPTLSIPSLNKLKNGLTIPNKFKSNLDNLVKNLPDFNEVKKMSNNATRAPFQSIIQQVNSSLSFYEFDRSLFPIPQKEKMTFCSDDPTINNFFDNLQRLIAKISKIIIGAVAGLALLAMIPMGWREIHSYRVTRRHAYMLSDPSQQFDPVDVVYIATRPHSSIFGLRIAGFFKSSRRQTLVRWAISYVTSPAALVVLSLGMAGLASIFCQWLLLKQVEAQAPGLAAQTGEFAKLIVEKLDNASKQWAIKSNEALNATNTEINKDVFGWVTTGTDSLNNTMNVFVDTMYGGVDTFFKGTPFATPIKEVLNCLITIKTVGIQRALTWAHDNAHVTLPLVPEDAFSRGAMNTIGPKSDSAASFLANPGSAASDEITEIVMKLTAKWEKSILQEAYISLALVGVWVLIVIIALIRTCFLCCVRDKVRGEGGAAPFVARDSNAALHRPQPPVFPTFGASPSTPYGPPSPEQYPDEKIQMGEVNSGQMGEYEGEGSKRESFHTRFYYKG